MIERESEGLLPPPPIIFLVFLLAGIAINRFWPWAFVTSGLRFPIGVPIVFLSFALFGLVLREFSKAESSVDHRKPTRELITSGPFRYSRNPIYVSMVMLSLGIAVLVNNFWIVLMTVPAAVAVHFLVIHKEEAFLAEKFGDEYRRYRASVRRWV